MAAQQKTHFQAPFHLSIAMRGEILINTTWAQVRRAMLGLNFKTSGLCFSSLFFLLARWNADGPAIQLLSRQGKSPHIGEATTWKEPELLDGHVLTNLDCATQDCHTGEE